MQHEVHQTSAIIPTSFLLLVIADSIRSLPTKLTQIYTTPQMNCISNHPWETLGGASNHPCAGVAGAGLIVSKDAKVSGAQAIGVPGGAVRPASEVVPVRTRTRKTCGTESIGFCNLYW